MPFLPVLLLAAPLLPPACRADQLRLSSDGRDGAFNGMSHAGTELSIRNIGRDCTVSALPPVQLRDARNHVLPAIRQVALEMRPGPIMAPVRLAAGHRATTDIRWVAGPVFPHNRSMRALKATVRIGSGVLTLPLRAVLYSKAGRRATFEQSPLRAEEGIAVEEAR